MNKIWCQTYFNDMMLFDLISFYNTNSFILTQQVPINELLFFLVTTNEPLENTLLSNP